MKPILNRRTLLRISIIVSPSVFRGERRTGSRRLFTYRMRGTRGALGFSPKDPPGATSFEIDVACEDSLSAREDDRRLLSQKFSPSVRIRLCVRRFPERAGERERDGERGNGTNDTRGTRGRL